MIAQVDVVGNTLLLPRREGFLAVLQTRLNEIRPIEGLTFLDQSRIEFNVMMENWDERKEEQHREISDVLLHKYGSETMSFGQPQLDEVVSIQIGAHRSELYTSGLERATEAVIAVADARQWKEG